MLGMCVCVCVCVCVWRFSLVHARVLNIFSRQFIITPFSVIVHCPRAWLLPFFMLVQGPTCNTCAVLARSSLTCQLAMKMYTCRARASQAKRTCNLVAGSFPVSCCSILLLLRAVFV